MLEKKINLDMAKRCSSQAYLNCMQLSASTCQTLNRQYMSDCFTQVPDTVPLDDPLLAQKMNSCGKKLAAELRVDMNKSDICEQAMEEEERPDPNAMTPMMYEQLKQQKVMEVIDLMREATGTGSRLDEITLPLYEPYELGIHMADGLDWKGGLGLPVVTLRLNASQDQVLAFYQQKLPDFKIEPHDPYMLVERVLPGEQNELKYLHVPNVIINGDDNETFVHITYRR
jgi:hypothetical protein